MPDDGSLEVTHKKRQPTMAQVQLIIDAYVRYLLNRKSQTNLQMLTLRQLVDSSMSSIDIEKDNRIELLNGAYDLSNKKIQNDLRCFYKNCRMFVLFVSLLFFFILFYFHILFCFFIFRQYIIFRTRNEPNFEISFDHFREQIESKL